MMESPTDPNSQTARRDWGFKARIAFNFKKTFASRKSAVDQPDPAQQSTQPTMPTPSSATSQPQEESLTPIVAQHPTPDEDAMQRMSIEGGLNLPDASSTPVPLIEVDMSSDPLMTSTTTIITTAHAASTEGKGEAFKRCQAAKAVFEKYGIPFDEDGWDMHPKSHVERISRAPRMRVRYTCHLCRTFFGHDRTCVVCAHDRCRKCARYPPRRKKSKLLRDPEAPTDGDTAPAPSGACHECQTAFTIGVLICENCQHQICERCLEETIANADQQQRPLLPLDPTSPVP